MIMLMALKKSLWQPNEVTSESQIVSYVLQKSKLIKRNTSVTKFYVDTKACVTPYVNLSHFCNDNKST